MIIVQPNSSRFAWNVRMRSPHRLNSSESVVFQWLKRSQPLSRRVVQTDLELGKNRHRKQIHPITDAWSLLQEPWCESHQPQTCPVAANEVQQVFACTEIFWTASKGHFHWLWGWSHGKDFLLQLSNQHSCHWAPTNRRMWQDLRAECPQKSQTQRPAWNSDSSSPLASKTAAWSSISSSQSDFLLCDTGAIHKLPLWGSQVPQACALPHSLALAVMSAEAHIDQWVDVAITTWLSKVCCKLDIQNLALCADGSARTVCVCWKFSTCTVATASTLQVAEGIFPLKTVHPKDIKTARQEVTQLAFFWLGSDPVTQALACHEEPQSSGAMASRCCTHFLKEMMQKIIVPSIVRFVATNETLALKMSLWRWFEMLSMHSFRSLRRKTVHHFFIECIHMTISPTASQQPSTDCTSTIVLDSSSVSSECPPFSSKRPINPPPYRLDFEPIVTATLTATQRKKVYDLNYSNNDTTAPLHRETLPPQKESRTNIHTHVQSTSKEASMVIPEASSTSNVRGVVYMLHGWAQNVHVFSNRARKLTKRLNKAGYKVVFLQGPHRLPVFESSTFVDSTTFTDGQFQPENERNGERGDKKHFSREYAYAWFLYDSPCNDDKCKKHSSNDSWSPVLQPSSTGNFPGMDLSLTFLRNELQTDRIDFSKTRTNQKSTSVDIPPFFILGFSQGAVLAHKLATLACGIGSSDDRNFASVADMYTSGYKSGGSFIDFQKCILVSGFSFTTSIRRNGGTAIYKTNGNDDHRNKIIQSSNTNPKRRTMPSFHVVGRKDSRVSPHLSLELYHLEPCFGKDDTHQKILWEHDRGHVLPQDTTFCNRLIEFLAEP